MTLQVYLRGRRRLGCRTVGCGLWHLFTVCALVALPLSSWADQERTVDRSSATAAHTTDHAARARVAAIRAVKGNGFFFRVKSNREAAEGGGRVLQLHGVSLWHLSVPATVEIKADGTMKSMDVDTANSPGNRARAWLGRMAVKAGHGIVGHPAVVTLSTLAIGAAAAWAGGYVGVDVPVAAGTALAAGGIAEVKGQRDAQRAREETVEKIATGLALEGPQVAAAAPIESAPDDGPEFESRRLPESALESADMTRGGTRGGGEDTRGGSRSRGAVSKSGGRSEATSEAPAPDPDPVATQRARLQRMLKRSKQ